MALTVSRAQTHRAGAREEFLQAQFPARRRERRGVVNLSLLRRDFGAECGRRPCLARHPMGQDGNDKML